MNRAIGLAISLLLLTGLLTACGVQDKVQTVDEAVSLLQDIKDRGTWTTVSDGLEALDDQHESYALTAQFSSGQADSSLQISVDAGAHALVEITENGQTRTYFVENYRSSSDSSVIYQIDAGRYTCAVDNDAARLLAHGPASLFDAYAITATGVQTLSVAEKDKNGGGTIAGRDTSRYDLVSRVPDALTILGRLDNPELQAKVDAAGHFELSGALYLDKDTAALLRFDNTYTDDQRQTAFSFEITQWGAVPDIPVPAASDIETPCQ
jgi:hypothetical protein